MTVHPASPNARSVARSRATLPSIFGPQYAELVFGAMKRCGQPCQKQPSMKTTTLRRVKAMSAVRLSPGTGR